MKRHLQRHIIYLFDNHVYMNIRYFLFVYLKTIDTAIQDIAYENVVTILDSNIIFLGSDVGSFERHPHILR